MVTPLITAVFLASVLGSMHCAGMCGAFLALATEDRGNWRRHAMLQSVYHLGRLTSYLSLGIAAGILGKLLNLTGALAGIGSAAAIVAGATMVFFGIVSLTRLAGMRGPRAIVPAFLSRWSQPLYKTAMNRPPVARAMLIGLATTLLPCGWLYAFVVTAAGTGSPSHAALTMLVFWAGTLPMLVALGAGLRTVLGPLHRKLPVITCLALVGTGLFTIVGRIEMNPRTLARSIEARGPATVPSAGTSACCQPENAKPAKGLKSQSASVGTDAMR